MYGTVAFSDSAGDVRITNGDTESAFHFLQTPAMSKKRFRHALGGCLVKTIVSPHTGARVRSPDRSQVS